jgi:ornithine--oxo-acid transaminase
MNTGAEAVETCIKIARKWAYTVKGVPIDQAEIIACQDNFHGRTTTIVGFSTEEGYRHNFGPYTPGFKVIPFGDAQALRDVITPNTAAFLVEPIQAEGGIIIPPVGWMNEVRQICTENNVLLIWDEVQTGFCRTGARFAWNHEDAKPDLMSVGKPLGGGILPVSAAVGIRSVMEVLKPGEHGSTFGGAPISCAVGLMAMAEMEKEDYAGKSARLGAKLIEGIKSINSPHITEVRGKGLLVGMELGESVDSAKLSRAFLSRGILTKETRQRTFRFTPPLVIAETMIDTILERTEDAIRSVTA